MPKPGHVSLWHPWKDIPKHRTHTLSYWQDDTIIIPSTGKTIPYESTNDLISQVGRNRLYVVCDDLLGTSFPDNISLLRDDRTEAYMSRTGKVVALRCRDKYSGFLIPARIWGGFTANEDIIRNMDAIFTLFGFEAITPASLSEKVLRDTLPDRCIISRPGDPLRRFLLDNSYGGRIDEKDYAEFFPVIRQIDMNKTYPYFARLTLSPFEAPYRIFYGETKHDDRWRDFPVSFMEATMIAHMPKSGIHPIQLKDETTGLMRKPKEGEVFTRGLFNFEIEDCLQAGYTLERIVHGYGWPTLSNWMEEWSDILYAGLEAHKKAGYSHLIKTLMVALPGRFLKSPENFLLLHEDEGGGHGEKDIPIDQDVITPFGISTPWWMRPEYNLDSAQLTPIGIEIVARARQSLYHKQMEVHQNGGRILTSYIDSISYISHSFSDIHLSNIGHDMGQWKQKTIKEAWVIGNQIIPYNIRDARMPGISGDDERLALWRKYHERGQNL